MSWDDGYVSEIGYVHGYYRELNPLMLDLALLGHGYEVPQRQTMRYLELGFGQGLSLNIHAAANPGRFWGNDFLPVHVANARALAESSSADIHLLEDSFAGLAKRTDLPTFDVIVLHGVWSWVSEENRQIILSIVRDKLALGGVLYVSYNVVPGWSMHMPVRDLMMDHMTLASPLGGAIADKINAAFDFTQRLIDAGAAYFKNTPTAVSYFDSIKKQPREYLAHEFFNATWAPMPFADVAGQLTDAGLQFVGSANTSRLFADALLSEQTKALLSFLKRSYVDELFYESMRDMCVNQKFRRDIWVRGGTRLDMLQRLQQLSDTRFTLLAEVTEETENISIPSDIGVMEINRTSVAPILAALKSDNYAPKTISQLREFPDLRSLSLAQLCDTVLLLCGRFVAPAHAAETATHLYTFTRPLNALLMKQAQDSDQSTFLASPVIGGAVPVTRIEQLFLLVLQNGASSSSDAIEAVLQILNSRGHKMAMPDGRLCETDDENRSAIETSARAFFEKRLPLLRALSVI